MVASTNAQFVSVVGKYEGKGNRLDDQGVDGVALERIYMKEIIWKGMDWICLAYEENQWQAVVKTVMDLRVS
jgi:hypothetical protein